MDSSCRARCWQRIRCFDGLGPLLARLYLAPIFILAGWGKWQAGAENIAHYFANIGIPLSQLSAYLATYTELIGGVLLLLGLGIRWITPPLMVTMIVAAVFAHWDNGWLAIANSEPSFFGTERSLAASQHLQELLSWLQQQYPDRYQALMSLGRPVMLNNGIEFAATYFVILLMLFFTGGGRYVSVDYYLGKRCSAKCL